MYRLGERDQSNDQDGTIEGGRTIWGEIAGIIKNLGLTPDYILWGTGWQNIRLMSADMPYWKPGKGKEKKRAKEKLETKDDFIDFLNL